jgi:hypothetical protein
MNSLKNKSATRGDMVDNATTKKYAITGHIKKWYWFIYSWFLNICMVQAWHLYMVNMKTRHQQLKVADWVEERGDSKKRDRESVRKRRRTEERMLEIPLLQFTRHVDCGDGHHEEAGRW